MGSVATVEIPFAFRKCMSRLTGLKFAPPDMLTHWEALGDLWASDLEAFEAAIARAARECEDFPAPKTLRGYADDAVRTRPLPPVEDRSVELPAPVDLGTVPGTTLRITAKRDWRYYCADCSDLGWLTQWCGAPLLHQGQQVRPSPWVGSGHCGRRGEHDAHEFVVPCPCAPSNPDVQRRRERERHGGKRGNE